MPKTILCYGDSNVWGSIASWAPTTAPSRRYDEHTRWPRAMGNLLGRDYAVVEEGLSGRNTVFHDPDAPYKNAEAYLLPCLLSHRPLDLVIMMLGTNDLKLAFAPAPGHLADGMARLVDIVQQCADCGSGAVPPPILLISPIHIARPQGRQDYFEARGGEACIDLVKLFAPAYRALAREKGCHFLDAAVYGSPDPADGLHLTEPSHLALGRAVAKEVRAIFAEA